MKQALRAMAARKAGELRDHPSPETLAAYHEGRLSREEADRLRDHLALCSECTEFLLDLSAFSESEPAATGEVTGVGSADREVQAAWQGMQARLGGEEVAPPAAAEIPENVVHLPPPKTGAPREPRRPVWTLAMAASWLLVAGLGVWVGVLQRENARLREPVANTVIADLPVVGDSTRGETEGLTALPSGKRLVLVLDIPDSQPHAGYEAELVSANGAVLWTGKGLPRDGSFNLDLPPGFLQPDVYRVRLYGIDPGGRQNLAEFSLRIAP